MEQSRKQDTASQEPEEHCNKFAQECGKFTNSMKEKENGKNTNDVSEKENPRPETVTVQDVVIKNGFHKSKVREHK